jgi:hypothetical protein
MSEPMSDAPTRVSLVTGGTRGIGAAVSELLACARKAVVAVYAGNHDAARQFGRTWPPKALMSPSGPPILPIRTPARGSSSTSSPNTVESIT